MKLPPPFCDVLFSQYFTPRKQRERGKAEKKRTNRMNSKDASRNHRCDTTAMSSSRTALQPHHTIHLSGGAARKEKGNTDANGLRARPSAAGQATSQAHIVIAVPLQINGCNAVGELKWLESFTTSSLEWNKKGVKRTNADESSCTCFEFVYVSRALRADEAPVCISREIEKTTCIQKKKQQSAKRRASK
jgi:hypothetical protein